MKIMINSKDYFFTEELKYLYIPPVMLNVYDFKTHALKKMAIDMTIDYDENSSNVIIKNKYLKKSFSLEEFKDILGKTYKYSYLENNINIIYFYYETFKKASNLLLLENKISWFDSNLLYSIDSFNEKYLYDNKDIYDMFDKIFLIGNGFVYSNNNILLGVYKKIFIKNLNTIIIPDYVSKFNIEELNNGFIEFLINDKCIRQDIKIIKNSKIIGNNINLITLDVDKLVLSNKKPEKELKYDINKDDFFNGNIDDITSNIIIDYLSVSARTKSSKKEVENFFNDIIF